MLCRGVACLGARSVSEGLVRAVWVLGSGYLVLPWPGSLRPAWHLDSSLVRKDVSCLPSFCSSSLYFSLSNQYYYCSLSSTYSAIASSHQARERLFPVSITSLSQVCVCHHVPANALISFIHLVLCRSRLIRCIDYHSVTLSVQWLSVLRVI